MSSVVPGERYELRIFRDGRLERRTFTPDKTPFAWKISFPPVAQTRMRWSVRDGESGEMLATDVPQTTICVSSDRVKDSDDVISGAFGGAVLETWVKSPEDRTVRCRIELSCGGGGSACQRRGH